MSIRKYENYKIIVTYDNGDKEEINYKGINTSSYKDMLNLYNEVKEKYSDRCVVIDFVGVGENGNLSVFWTKKIDNKIEEESIESKTSIELIESMKSILETLRKKETNMRDKLGVVNKEQDIQLHKIENFNKNTFVNESDVILEKIRIFDELERIRHERRQVKNEEVLFKDLLGRFNVKELIEKTGGVICHYNKLINKNNNVEYFSDEKLEELEIIKKVKYRTERERISLITQLKPKYDKVYYEKGEVICYNRGYGSNKKAQ